MDVLNEKKIGEWTTPFFSHKEDERSTMDAVNHENLA